MVCAIGPWCVVYDSKSLHSPCIANDSTNFTGDKLTNKQTNRQTNKLTNIAVAQSPHICERGLKRECGRRWTQFILRCTLKSHYRWIKSLQCVPKMRSA